jgi:mannose-6-phosphate isomerase-like protein (cupin superfamily)
MNIVKNHEALVRQNTAACVAYEYDMSADSVNGAVIEISGRYPDTGWALNTVCTSLVYIIEGLGTVEGDRGVRELASGDQLLIAPGEKYSFDGTMKLLYVATPTWTLEQAKHIT